MTPDVRALFEAKVAAGHKRLTESAGDLLAALTALHRICLDCDLEDQNTRPTEEEYVAAMDAAEAAIARATGVQT